MARNKQRGHDAGRGIVLVVTDEIINASIPRDSSHCVWADAIKAAVPTATRISVDLQTMAFTDPVSKRRYVYLTPARAQVDLVKFDQGIRPEPCVLMLGKPAQIRKSGTSRPAAQNPPLKELPEDGKAVVVLEESNRAAPQILGGQLPPVAALSNRRGRRRTFGIKSTGSPGW